ncbi:hypothetical protein DYB30_008982 [Aphanomyces astaci]|uniref:CW-type domain-containing protein n=1 Tax=Aphanomyces astaci TaxID=112090 RepID=A0A397C670_APHAT|nr:hypothetical protein DYB30_008982 [Aphanomyces astaci]
MADSGGESSSSSSSSDTLLVRKQRLLSSSDVKKQTVHAPDSICDRCDALLDNGSIILACTGACFRKFHIACCPNEIQSSSWQCVDCRTNSHPCFVCQETTRNHPDDPVVACRAAGCGKFYHVACVTRLPLTRVLEGVAAFICPLHTCHQCEGQSHGGAADQAIRCTRCPRAYHATCFPPSGMCPPCRYSSYALGFERLCSTRGLCHAHFGAATDDDDDKRTKKEHKKDKKDKKKKKKKDKKQKKDKKSVNDETYTPPRPANPPVEPQVSTGPDDVPMPHTILPTAPQISSLPSCLPLFRPLQERAKSGGLKPPPLVVVAPLQPPPPLALPPVESPPPLNITIPTSQHVVPSDATDDDAAKALSARNKKKKKRKRVRASAVLLTPTEEDAKWVQCDRCKKWRTVPPQLDLSAMSNTAWYCIMNDWDVRYASCDVPEEVVEPKAKKAKLNDDMDDDNDVPVMAPGTPPSAAAAAPPPVSIKPEQPDGMKKETKLTKKQRAKLKSTVQRGKLATPALPGGVDSSAKEIEWVQCESKTCGKWRVVPPSIDIASLPIKWYCSLNTWAPSLATCAAENPSDVESLWQSKTVKSPPPPPSKQPPRQGKVSPRHQSLHLQGALPTVGDAVVAAAALALPSSVDSPSGHVDSPVGGKNKKIKPPELIPVLEWAQCEKCNKWRKLPAHVKSVNLPDKWFCSMNHWNPAVPMPIGPRPKRGKLSYRELLYAGNGHLRKAFTDESSTLSFEFEGTLFHRDDQYRKSSMYLAPMASMLAPSNPPNSPLATPDIGDGEAADLTGPELDTLKRCVVAVLKQADSRGKSIVDLVAALHSDKGAVPTTAPPSSSSAFYSYAAVDRAVQAMVASGDMEAFQDERLVTVTVPIKISSYASAYYVAGENNHETRTWKERHTGPHLLYRRKIQYKQPLKMAKPWKQKGFTGWIKTTTTPS